MAVKNGILYALTFLGVALISALTLIVLTPRADGDVKLAVVVQFSTVLGSVVTIIGGLYVSQMAGRMADQLGNSIPSPGPENDARTEINTKIEQKGTTHTEEVPSEKPIE